MTKQKSDLTPTMLADRVIDLYLDRGEYLTVKEIAEAVGVSESIVRRRLLDESAFLRDSRLTHRREGRASYSRDYPGMEFGAHQVWTYGPTMDCLRSMVRTAREALDMVRQERVA